MNKTDIIEIMSKRTTKLAVLSVVFVGMMVLLVPALVQESQALTTATAVSQVGQFSDVKAQIFSGQLALVPRVVGPVIGWMTTGNLDGNERGVVSAKVAGVEVHFVFNNPARGDNTCQATVNPSGPIHAKCHISQGPYASATFEVSNRNQGNDNNYCDILNKIGSEKIKAIKEKLNC